MQKLFLALTLSGFLVGCTNSNSDANKIADAQTCLNSATSSTVNQCLTPIQDMTTPSAYLIRCAAAFIQEGLNTARLASVISQLKESGSTPADGSTVFSVLAFRNDTTPTNNMNDITNATAACTTSGSTGLILLANSSLIATSVLNAANSALLTPGSSINAAAIQGAITAQQDIPATQTAIGSAAIAAYQSACTGNNVSGAQGICSQYQTALAAASNPSNPTSVGCQLLKAYSTPPTGTACP